MYIETSIPQRPGYDATLMSPALSGQGEDICMRFYYHAFGDDTGVLLVRLKLISLGLSSVLFTLSGDQGDEWQPANIALRESDIGFTSYQVHIIDLLIYLYSILLDSIANIFRKK